MWLPWIRIYGYMLINWYASLYSMGYLASLAYAIVKLLSTSIARVQDIYLIFAGCTKDY